MKRMLPLLLGAAFWTAASPVAAQELGRLFFTPEQRNALDARRKARMPDNPAAAAVTASPTMRLDGYVKRSGGRPTVWVNGESVDDSRPPAGGSDDKVDISVGDRRSRVGMKPGEVLDRGNGEVRDMIGGGEIKIRPAGPAR
jgi:hypothetical protein